MNLLQTTWLGLIVSGTLVLTPKTFFDGGSSSSVHLDSFIGLERRGGTGVDITGKTTLYHLTTLQEFSDGRFLVDWVTFRFYLLQRGPVFLGLRGRRWVTSSSLDFFFFFFFPWYKPYDPGRVVHRFTFFVCPT